MIFSFKNLRENIESFLAWLNTTLKQTIDVYCDLETADSQESFATHDGALVSIIQIEGIKHIIAEQNFQSLCEHFTLHLKTAFLEKGHTLQVVFQTDPQAIVSELQTLYFPAQKTNQRLHLGLEELLKERMQYLSNYCSSEKTYFVLRTHPDRLNRTQYKEAEKSKLQLIRNKQLPFFRLTQNLIAAIPELRNMHNALLKSILNELTHLDIQANLLKVHEAAKVIRQLVEPDFTDPSWNAHLPGDKIPLKEYKRYQNHIVDVSWPSLTRQLFPRDAENIDLRTVRVGNRIYSCIFVDLLPKETQSFSDLLRRTIGARIPFRISFLMGSDALQTLRFKSLLANILSFSSQENRLLSDAYNLLQYMALNSDEAITQLKVVACTWADEHKIDILRIRTAELAKAIQGWGIAEVSEISGDTFAGFMSTLPGVLSNQAVATTTVLPFSAAVSMLPITRPASPWQHGSQIFRTQDGKLWPFELGSSQQTTWIDLIYARPGSGKSILSNILNLSLCLKEGLQSLPYIAIVDIGLSSKGLISLLRESVSPELTSQIVYHRVHMTKQYTINPFDTQLGLRYPIAQERAFLINFLTLLATPLDATASYDGIADMVGLVVDELYKRFSDEGQPCIYTKGVEAQVDAALESISRMHDTKTTWWEITDCLFEHHYIQAAILAQRHATPILSDVLSTCRERVVQDLYGQIQVSTGEMLIEVFIRMISRAIREYCVLSGITQFDLYTARVVALDLEEVAKGGGPAADRQTAVMYMLARYVLTRSYYLHESSFEHVSQQYYLYHQKRVQICKDSVQRLVFDEFHRTAKVSMVREQVLTDMREGRKWNVQIAVLSQSLEDFDPMMVEFATSIYILDAGPIPTLEKSTKVFGLSVEAKNSLRDHVHGPTASGTNFLAQFVTTSGVYTQLLTLTLAPTELWALSTTVEDVMLRDTLYQSIGPSNARNILARVFPSGTIRPVIEKRLLDTKNSEKTKIELVKDLTEELLETYGKQF